MKKNEFTNSYPFKNSPITFTNLLLIFIQNISPIIITSNHLLAQYPIISIHNDADQKINQNNHQEEGTYEHKDRVGGGEGGVYVRFQEIVRIKNEHCVDFCEEEEKAGQFVVDYVQ